MWVAVGMVGQAVLVYVSFSASKYVWGEEEEEEEWEEEEVVT